MSQQAAREAAELAARRSYGKLVAYLSARSRDVLLAEDALSDALMAALKVWPEHGVPDSPEAWLMVAARRNIGRSKRHGNVIRASHGHLALAAEEMEQAIMDATDLHFPDDRLKLLFVCTHPAIDRSIHAPLMLQTVLGVEAKSIASAFLISPATMGQRLVRAKAKIRDAGIPFAVPEWHELPKRIHAVLSGIYAAFTLGWDEMEGTEAHSTGLAGEAVWLCRALDVMMPGQPEINGLLALMLFNQSRSNTRLTPDRVYVPLEDQETTDWDHDLIDKAEQLLLAAGRMNIFGPYQCQAAIQAVHAHRRKSGVTDWHAIDILYSALLEMRPTIGARVGYAAVKGRLADAASALCDLDAISAEDVASYQPFWAVRAHLLAQTGRLREAADAYATAIGLSSKAPVRQYLSDRMPIVAKVDRT